MQGSEVTSISEEHAAVRDDQDIVVLEAHKGFALIPLRRSWLEDAEYPVVQILCEYHGTEPLCAPDCYVVRVRRRDAGGCQHPDLVVGTVCRGEGARWYTLWPWPERPIEDLHMGEISRIMYYVMQKRQPLHVEEVRGTLKYQNPGWYKPPSLVF